MTRDNPELIKLEEEVAHLSVSNEEMSSEILGQWKRIEELEKKISKLENRLAGMEEAIDNPVITTKPPHW